MQLPHPHRPAEPFPCAWCDENACPHSRIRHSHSRQLRDGEVCVQGEKTIIRRHCLPFIPVSPRMHGLTEAWHNAPIHPRARV